VGCILPYLGVLASEEFPNSVNFAEWLTIVSTCLK
jgi:hypothetical protein